MAEQIRATRLARGWTQSDLARATNKVQETISQLENPNYGSYTIKTLERLAEALDVKLTVRFDPFSELVDWLTGLSAESFAVPDFDHDPGLHPGADRIEATQTAQAAMPLLKQDPSVPNARHLYLVPSPTPSRVRPPLPSEPTAGEARTRVSDHTPQPQRRSA